MRKVTNLEEQLRLDEGEKLSAYQDHLGYWTIGIGRLIDARKGGGITHDEARYLLKNRVDDKLANLSKALPWFVSKPEPVQRALANMAYQMGVDGLLSFKNTLALIEAGEYDKAATMAMQSLWARQTPNRAKRVTDLLRSAQT